MRSASDIISASSQSGILALPEVSPWRQVRVGVIASILLHVLLLLLVFVGHLVLPIITALLLKILPKSPDPQPTRPQEIELTIVPPAAKEEPPPALALEANPEKVFLDSRGLAEASEAAKDAMIESDKNMKAASELPASGDAPLPSQDGLNRPTPNFTTQQDTLGGKSTPMETERPKPEPVDVAAAVPPMPALYKPQPIPKENIDPAKNEPALDKPLPAPATETPPTLPQLSELNAIAQRAMDKLKQVMEADEDEIPLTTKAMVTPPKEMTDAPPVERPRPVPIAQPKPVATPQPAPRQEMAKLTTPAPRAPKSGYQPQLEKTRIEGSISNRGKSAVDAVSTPLARYKKQVNDAIGSRWYYYIRGKMDLIAAGSVHMSFSINDRGQPVGVRVDSNTSNQSLADVCERAIREAELDPPPPELVAPLKDGRLDYSLTFTFYNL